MSRPLGRARGVHPSRCHRARASGGVPGPPRGAGAAGAAPWPVSSGSGSSLGSCGLPVGIEGRAGTWASGEGELQVSVPAAASVSGWLGRAGRVTGTERNPLQRLALLCACVFVPFMRPGENSAMHEHSVSLV